MGNTRVERSTADGGWDAVAIDPPVRLTSGSAPSNTVCWLIGPNGIVLRTTDGRRFVRVPFPDTSDLAAIRALDSQRATVTTTNGRVLSTTDAGVSWR